MSDFLIQKTNPEAHVVNDIPALISSQMLTKPVIACKASVRSVISTSSSLTNGGSAYLYLPSSTNSFIKSGSTFLNFTLSVVTSATGATAAFSFGGGPIQDASALVQRMQISSNTILENIQFYTQASNMYVLNKTNSNYVQQDLQALAGANFSQAGYNLNGEGTTVNSSFNISIPVLLGVLNSPDSYFPLCLTSSSPAILVDFQSNLNMIFTTAVNNSVTSYTVSNIQLSYECIEVDPLYVQELRMALREGGVYSFSAQNIQMIAQGDSTLVNQEYGLSCNSLNQVSLCNYTTPSDQTSAGAFTANSQTIGQVYIDNEPVINSRPQDVTKWQSLVYANNKSGWCSLWDPTMSHAVPTCGSAASGFQVIANSASSPYVLTAFTSSAPLSSFNEAGLIFCGRPCNRCRIEIQKSSVANSQLYVLFVRDCIYQIGADGSISQKF